MNEQVSLRRVRVVDEREAVRLCDLVHSLREHWTRRHPALPSFTLGAASYLDAREHGLAAYVARAHECNPILDASFAGLYRRVLEEISGLVGERVLFSAPLARPGFHVFLFHPAFEQPLADVHFDLQYQWLDWSHVGGIEPETQISFTLPLRIPAGGAGLTIWKSDWRELESLTPVDRATRIRASVEREDEDYCVGEMVVHTGHWLHRIRQGKDLTPQDERVTLQGHVIRTGHGWIAYW